LDGGYATLINDRKHAFVYYHNAQMDSGMISVKHYTIIAIGCEMKNRRTGHVSSTFAKQIIINLPDAERKEIVGYYAGENTLFLLTQSTIYVNDVKVRGVIV
jgi:hypothetical protein